ncbi:MAG: molybdopterin-dependent oxidoreductase [Chloroflexi bacterium]|nr:molybdopterin-dependent oxidoreductase [Chloroflexota bacterium]
MPQDARWVPTICRNCTKGPCPVRVRIVNGAAVNIEGNASGPGFSQFSNNRGRVCAKAYGMLHKLYNPHRIKSPLKRTNPRKGRDIDPQFAPVSWDEALTLLTARLADVRARNTNLLSLGPGGPQMITQGGTWDAFFQAYGPTQYLGAGGSIRCDMAEHVFGNLMHGGYHCEPDLPYCNYAILIGCNTSGSGGAPETVLYSDARARGMKTVVVDPYYSLTASKADLWLPIKPGTDLAFMLALIHMIVCELGRYDTPFLKTMSNAPYLVGSDGNFVRDASGKVLVWDTVSNRPKPYNAPDIQDPALEGTYTVDGNAARPGFQALKDHVIGYTPEWASAITEIPAGQIRQVARDYVQAARIGSTIRIDGLDFPLRPVAIKIGRGLTGQTRAYHVSLAQHILALLVGGLMTPGGHLGGGREGGHLYSGIGISPGPDGMIKLNTYPFTWPPASYCGTETLLPYCKVYPLGHPRHLAYRNLLDPPKNFPLPPPPEVYIKYRQNPVLSIGEPELVYEALRRIPFIVSFSYVPDEITELADLVLPEHLDLERYELCTRIRDATGKKFIGAILRQPVIEPVQNTMEISEVFTELADRIGFLDKYNEAVNNQLGLTATYRLESGKKYPWNEIVDRHCRSVTGGEHGLEWFREHGGYLKPVPASHQYDVYLEMLAKKMRFHLPYMEHVKKTGEDLARNLASVGVDWWPTDEYLPLPTYFPSVLQETPAEYDFYVTTTRPAQFSWGSNIDCPWLNEASDLVPGQTDIIMNSGAARARGIKNGDEVWVESEVGRIRRRVRLTEGIRPDTLMIMGQFGQWAMPVARDSGRVSQVTLTRISPDRTDHFMSNMQASVIKAKMYRARQ